MNSATYTLSEDPDQLKSEVIRLQDSVTEKARRIEPLLDYILLLRKRPFGAHADRLNRDQRSLFDEAELEQLLAEQGEPVDPGQKEPTAQDPAAGSRKKPARRPLPADLQRIEKIIDFGTAEKAAMGDDWICISDTTSEQLAVIPRQHDVIAFKRAKYAPRNDAVAGAEQGLKIAPRPAQILPKSIAHSSVIADVVVRKFVDGLPFYRQGAIYTRDHIKISRPTMSGWVMQLHERLMPLLALMKR